MSTRSLSPPEDVKELAAAVDAEKCTDFVADATASRGEAIASGKGFPAAEVHAYLRERAVGKISPKPEAKAWRSRKGRTVSGAAERKL